VHTLPVRHPIYTPRVSDLTGSHTGQLQPARMVSALIARQPPLTCPFPHAVPQVVDYPNSTKAKKFFLCLYCGPPSLFRVRARALPHPRSCHHLVSARG
jgi:hypothetical protein